MPRRSNHKDDMKLFVAVFASAIVFGGCVTVPAPMQPDAESTSTEVQHPVELPPESKPEPEESDNPCLNKVANFVGRAADAVEGAYQEASDSDTVKDVRKAAKKAGSYLHKKAVEYHEAAKEAAK